MKRLGAFSLVIVGLVLILLVGAATHPGQADAAQVSVNAPAEVTGVLSVVWGDDPQGHSQVQFWLQPLSEAAALQPVRLEMPNPMPLTWKELAGLWGQEITVQGSWASPVMGSGENVRFQVADIQTAPGRLAPLALTGPQPWVSVLCKFNNVAAEPKAPGYFADMFSNVFPGLDHYWREVSYNQITMAGSYGVSHWYTLPHGRSYYIYDIDGNGTEELSFVRSTEDCTAVADDEVNFSNFVGINLMFNSDLDGYAWGGGHWLTLDGVTKQWRVTWEPPWGYSDIAVIAHENGHGFGLPHSADSAGTVYANEWDVMSDTWSNCDNLRSTTFGCLGQHTISYHKDIDGWLDGRKISVDYGTQVTLTLERLSTPESSNYLMITIPIGGSISQFYTLEARKKTGYDLKLPGEGVIIHDVMIARSDSMPAHLVDANGGDSGDAGAIWTVGETFSDAENQITVRVLADTGTGYTVLVDNHSGGVIATSTPTPSPTPGSPLGVNAAYAATNDAAWDNKTSFVAGDTIIYEIGVLNETTNSQTVHMRYLVTGPCGTIYDEQMDWATGPGGIAWGMTETVPPDACAGEYTFTGSITYNHVTTSAATTFTVISRSTSTPTPTVKSTGTSTPTRTVKPTGTSTPTPTITRTPSATLTATITQAPTSTATATATLTRTSTPTVTRTLTRTPTQTSTPRPPSDWVFMPVVIKGMQK